MEIRVISGDITEAKRALSLFLYVDETGIPTLSQYSIRDSIRYMVYVASDYEFQYPYEWRVYDPCCGSGGMFVDVKHPGAGTFRVVNSPFKFSRSHYKVERASPELGEHTYEVLSQLPGMTQDEIKRLRDSGVI